MNPRRLTNADIAVHYNDVELHMMRQDFTGMFARWVVKQSPYEVPMLTGALAGFNDYITGVMGGEEVKKFTYEELSQVFSEEEFEKIPDVLALNVARVQEGPGYANRHEAPSPHYDFIDLGALARNIFYSLVRSHICWADEL